MTPYFLDTNVCIDLLRGKSRGRRLPPYTACHLSAVVVAELWTGVSKANDPLSARNSLGQFLELFNIAAFDAPAAQAYGEIRAHLEKAGTPIGTMDQLIAAHARSAGAIVITANLKEFRRVPGLKCHAWE